MAEEHVVIVGAGQAGLQTADSLRRGGHTGPITLIGEEAVAPYQRPPLSKAYLSGAMGLDRVVLKPASTLADEHIDFVPDTRITEINRDARTVSAADGRSWSWDWLVLATGSRVRRLELPGAGLGGVHYLRTIADVEALRPDLAAGGPLVVIGGGYIGLEVAAVARTMGLHVTLVEAAARVLARVTTAEVSAYYEQLHRARGVDIRTGTGVSGIEGTDGRVSGVVLADGTVIPAAAVLIGIGIVPNSELATAAGLAAANGIETDTDARTADQRIFAVGDCASRPLAHYGDRRGRLESVHNALEQGKLAAAAILGLPRPPLETPWFWSDQYEIKLQTAGLCTGAVTCILRGDPSANRFAAFHLDAGNRLLAVDAVNAPPEFVVGKQLIARQATVAPAKLADMSVSMKEIGINPV
jgi:3-phenylpropionate/trans-cinnamate dioxygenase ferredoxin reductase component